MAVTAAFQFELNGLLMGPGTDYEITRVGGLGSLAVRSRDLDLIEDGVFAARDSREPFTLRFDFEIHGASNEAVIPKVRTWMTAWASTNTDVELTFRLADVDGNRYVLGRPRRTDWTIDLAAAAGFVTASADFFCQDPTIYDADDDSEVVL